jgi:hypothetical protein
VEPGTTLAARLAEPPQVAQRADPQRELVVVAAHVVFALDFGIDTAEDQEPAVARVVEDPSPVLADRSQLRETVGSVGRHLEEGATGVEQVPLGEDFSKESRVQRGETSRQTPTGAVFVVVEERRGVAAESVRRKSGLVSDRRPGVRVVDGAQREFGLEVVGATLTCAAQGSFLITASEQQDARQLVRPDARNRPASSSVRVSLPRT